VVSSASAQLNLVSKTSAQLRQKNKSGQGYRLVWFLPELPERLLFAVVVRYSTLLQQKEKSGNEV
jgi:hypothetical protein